MCYARRAAYEAGMRDAALANAKSTTERSGIIAGVSENDIELAESLSKALKRDILFVVCGWSPCFKH